MRGELQFHQARWNEPIVFELGSPGERGYVPPPVEASLAAAAGSLDELVPEAARRTLPPALPEISQPRLRKHFLRLSQETMGAAIGVDIGQGTATMKFSPPVLDRIARHLQGLHPLAPVESVQGVLEIVKRFEDILRALSGLDRFSFQPGGGTHGIYANACIVRAWHARRGEPQRDEIITSSFSHPGDAAAPATAGFRVVTLRPGRPGAPDIGALRSARCRDRTAGMVITNPEDTGIFKSNIDEFVRIVHDAGGLCVQDQANANGMLGIARWRDAGFDACHFNLHKTFSSPHGSGGLACGAIGVRSELAPFLPGPTVERAPDGSLFLDHDRPLSAGRVRAFYGAIDTVVRAYAWAVSLGADGLRQVAETAVLNNNYLAARLGETDGIDVSFNHSELAPRLEQIRYSLADAHDRSGLGTEAISRRTSDYGVAGYFPSHHPWTVSEPMTLEPTESASRKELDDYVELLRAVLAEAESHPERVDAAPERSSIHRLDETSLDDPASWALTWRAYRRKRG